MIKLADVLCEPSLLIALPLKAQSDIISEARYLNMLAQLKAVFEQANLWDSLSIHLKQHIDSAIPAFSKQQQHLMNEATMFSEILSPLDIKWVYLKGSAYHLAKFEEFQGRLMADIDILVSEDALSRVEKVLKEHGWVQTKLNDYDERFYREKSQEIPPLKHCERQTELDLHFNILPNTIKASPDPEILMAQTMSLDSGNSNAQILTPAAMVIHSSVHLFYESEFHKGLRDLYDLFLLFTRFSKDALFWDDLISLQQTLGNGDSQFYALRYCHLVFGLKIPKHVQQFYNQYEPNKAKLLLSDFAFMRIFVCTFPPHRRLGHQIAENILYIRGHLKRMPIHMLIPHLITKFFRQLSENKKTTKSQ
ncbi:nucleotidyltransferase domain-containing protein [Vibrio algarum]|uniref:Nucleotidyltransferase family protein n=1 Tax=Vibrio algarum TaxID=3020714 RepID=A0ABT4YQ61_9VIBR|nr:nucleotidyltransferase family protein [Vibrio sp. KJ40-1]MDB1123691.1 nucleotidyltransferase family protein [Vibrio sp. KJ40-1]